MIFMWMTDCQNFYLLNLDIMRKVPLENGVETLNSEIKMIQSIADSLSEWDTKTQLTKTLTDASSANNNEDFFDWNMWPMNADIVQIKSIATLVGKLWKEDVTSILNKNAHSYDKAITELQNAINLKSIESDKKQVKEASYRQAIKELKKQDPDGERGLVIIPTEDMDWNFIEYTVSTPFSNPE